VDNKTYGRAIRYRRLALAEPDASKVALLLKLADEAERGVLCTVDRTLQQQAMAGNIGKLPTSS
jgi:hypothetical protein